MARPSTSVKTSTGSTVPSAAAFSGFTGTMSTMRWASDGMWRAASEMPAVPALDRSDAATSGEMTSPFSTSGATNIVKTPPATSSTTNTGTAQAPRRPTRRRSVAPPTPLTTSVMTSGITVIRIALIQIVPTGSTTATVVAAA